MMYLCTRNRQNGQMKRLLYLIIICAIVALTMSCSKPDRDDEAVALSTKIVSEGLSDSNHALERVDSAEQVGVFTAVRANTIKAIVYSNAGQRRVAAYYAEKAIAAEAGQAVTTSADSNLYFKVRYVLADGAYINGEYGKSLAIAKEILAFVGDGTTPKDVETKCRALMQMADCESKLGHIAESERLFLQCIDDLMASTQHATGYGEIDPLIYTLLSLNDLYIDNNMPEKALPLIEKMDTAMNRLTRCSNTPDWAIKKRRKNVTISKAMAYAANHQREQADALHHEYQQFQDLGAFDKAAEGVYLTMMGRYGEAVGLLDDADSMMCSNGEPITDLYVKTILQYKYDALQKAERTTEALALSERIRQLTDSISQQERLADVEQLQKINRQEEEIASRRKTVIIYRILVVAALLVCMFVAYLFWRAAWYNKIITEKNHRLLEEIEQREREQQQSIQQLESAPEESLTAEQQLYCRLCALMAEQQPYTDENLNRDMLAQLLGTNAKYVVQAIRDCSHGETVGDFITRYRLEHVAHLLKTTDDPIGVIGELSGISSRVTLSRVFRNAYGMTCREYRQVSQQKK